MSDDNPSAFPQADRFSPQGEPGMSLRDWFAGQALACVAHEYIGGTTPKTALAEDCYEMADAMLAARKVKP